MTATANITGRMLDIIMTGSTTAGLDTEGTASTISVGPGLGKGSTMASTIGNPVVGLGKGPTFTLSTTPVVTCSRSGPAGQTLKRVFTGNCSHTQTRQEIRQERLVVGELEAEAEEQEESNHGVDRLGPGQCVEREVTELNIYIRAECPH